MTQLSTLQKNKEEDNFNIPYVSFIIPSFKGADILKKNIPVLRAYLESKNFTYEVIIIDDGSEDNGATEKAAYQLGCKFLSNPINMGKGAAVRNGMIHSKGKFKIFTDGDVPYEVDILDKFLYYLDFKEFDMVVGDRTLIDSSYFTEIPKIRSFGSKIFSAITGRFITTGQYDTQCGIKGFRAEVANDIFSVSKINGFAFDVEIFYLSFKRNYDIKRLPVSLRCQDGDSVNVLKHGMTMVMDLPKIIFNFYKGRYVRASSVKPKIHEETPI